MKKVNIFFVIVTGFLIVSFFGCNLISGGSGSLNKPVTEVITKKIGISDCQKIKNDSLLFSIPEDCGRVELINLWDEYDDEHKMNSGIGFPFEGIKYSLVNHNGCNELVISGKSLADRVMEHNEWEDVSENGINSNDVAVLKKNGYFV